jgi:hypothetical protein
MSKVLEELLVVVQWVSLLANSLRHTLRRPVLSSITPQDRDIDSRSLRQHRNSRYQRRSSLLHALRHVVGALFNNLRVPIKSLQRSRVPTARVPTLFREATESLNRTKLLNDHET